MHQFEVPPPMTMAGVATINSFSESMVGISKASRNRKQINCVSSQGITLVLVLVVALGRFHVADEPDDEDDLQERSLPQPA